MPVLREAQARLKINNLLQAAGWRLLDENGLRANVSLEHRVAKLTFSASDLGNDLEKAPNGFIDYLLLNDQQRPVALIEAKRERTDPLDAKEQARAYARSLGVRHVFLSNGNVHYYWDLESGNPTVISRFLSLEQLGEATRFQPNPEKMRDQALDENYIALSQDAAWLTYTPEQQAEIRTNKDIRVLRDYQVTAANKLRSRYLDGHRRFLFEMATGTGKTLLSAAIIKLFIRSGNADRVLFLVDRIELEAQAYKNFKAYLENDGIIPALLKSRRELPTANTNWQKAHILITTVQSLTAGNRYLTEFAPSDFQLIISDEAHRTLGGNNRVIFEYFIGAKLGLTATPRDYLKGVDFTRLQLEDPRQAERRLLLDTYRTFGCEDGIPTFRFSLEDAVKHRPPYLCLPKLVDARTGITTQMLSEEGWTVRFTNDDGDEEEDTYYKRDFMRRFFSEETNLSFVRCFLENARVDPISGEIGKTIFFGVTRPHCRVLTRLLNQEAARLYPHRYGSGSDFAQQITSDIIGSQEATISFANNNLNGWSKFNPALVDYPSSKTRVCVTVGMMTTGYDCPDLLNVVLARPIFSPTDYIQIKGRGTRLFEFRYGDTARGKDTFFLFDFFANHDYFEEEYDYEQKIVLAPEQPAGTPGGEDGPSGPLRIGAYVYTGADDVVRVVEEHFDRDHLMRVDLEAFSRSFESRTEQAIRESPELTAAVEAEDWQAVGAYVKENVFNRPSEFWNLTKLQEAYDVDRRVSLTEILQKIFQGQALKTRADLVEEQFQRFLGSVSFNGAQYEELHKLFAAYLLYDDIRQMFNEKQFGRLGADMRLSIQDLKALGAGPMQQTIDYIKDHVVLNPFLPK